MASPADVVDTAATDAAVDAASDGNGEVATEGADASLWAYAPLSGTACMAASAFLAGTDSCRERYAATRLRGYVAKSIMTAAAIASSSVRGEGLREHDVPTWHL